MRRRKRCAISVKVKIRRSLLNDVPHIMIVEMAVVSLNHPSITMTEILSDDHKWSAIHDRQTRPSMAQLVECKSWVDTRFFDCGFKRPKIEVSAPTLATFRAKQDRKSTRLNSS